MAYQNNIPQPTDQLAVSQADILGNFAAIQTLINVNHVDFASGDQGKHKWVTLPVQTPSPPIAFNPGELALYSFLNPTTSVNELYINKTNQFAVVQVPMTASILSTNSAPVGGTQGWSYLPSGILLKWGFGTATGSTDFLFPVAADIPAFTAVFSMNLTALTLGIIDPDIAVTLSGFNNLGYRAYGSNRTTTGAAACLFQYLAIGY